MSLANGYVIDAAKKAMRCTECRHLESCLISGVKPPTFKTNKQESKIAFPENFGCIFFEEA